MKRFVSLISVLALSLVFCACSAGAGLSSSSWTKAFYLDSFNQPTDYYYIGTKNRAKGTYNSSNVTEGKLEAELRVDPVEISIMLYENGTDKVKNGEKSWIEFPITVKKADGSTFRVTGILYGGQDYISIMEDQSQCVLIDTNTEQTKKTSIATALCAENGEVSFYITRKDQPATNYLFSVNCGNFSELYTSEIANPIYEQQYQDGCNLLKKNKYEGAIRAFEKIKQYKDSIAQIEIAREAINNEKYQAAMQLLKSKQYAEAISAFTALGSYGDSAEQVVKAQEAAYNTAESLMNNRQYMEARQIFDYLGSYRDAATMIKETQYLQACQLMDNSQFQDAIDAFTEIKSYKDSEELISQCENGINEEIYVSACSLMDEERYKEAISTFQKITHYKDSENLIVQCESRITEKTYATAYSIMEEELSQSAYHYRSMQVVEAFESISDYKDSMDLAIRCFRHVYLTQQDIAKSAEEFFKRNISLFTPMTASEFKKMLDENNRFFIDHYSDSYQMSPWKREAGIYEIYNSEDTVKIQFVFENGKWVTYYFSRKKKGDWKESKEGSSEWYQISDEFIYQVHESGQVRCWHIG